MIKARIFCVPQELLSFQIYLDLVMDRHLGKSKDASNLKVESLGEYSIRRCFKMFSIFYRKMDRLDSLD